MPLNLRRGTVTAILERAPGLARLEVDGFACVAYPDLTGPVGLGDDVVINVEARRLGLGSGGFDVLYLNLTRGLGLESPRGAHVMNLPYTPLQHAAVYAEEKGPLAETLDGMPVVCCSVHSQLAPVCAALAGSRVAYVQLEGGALPVALSDALRELRGRGLLETTIGAGAAFGGDVDCVNVYSALAWVKSHGFDVAVCSVGPGIVGTGTRLGHGAMSAAIALGATAQLGGNGVLALRVSEHDTRPRHRGLSHHADAILSLFSSSLVHAWAEIVDVSGWREACAGLTLSHMGRGPDEDPWFFAAAYAAGVAGRRLVG
jgi:hypothetical protein